MWRRFAIIDSILTRLLDTSLTRRVYWSAKMAESAILAHSAYSILILRLGSSPTWQAQPVKPNNQAQPDKLPVPSFHVVTLPHFALSVCLSQRSPTTSYNCDSCTCTLVYPWYSPSQRSGAPVCTVHHQKIKGNINEVATFQVLLCFYVNFLVLYHFQKHFNWLHCSGTLYWWCEWQLYCTVHYLAGTRVHVRQV